MWSKPIWLLIRLRMYLIWQPCWQSLPLTLWFVLWRKSTRDILLHYASSLDNCVQNPPSSESGHWWIWTRCLALKYQSLYKLRSKYWSLENYALDGNLNQWLPNCILHPYVPTDDYSRLNRFRISNLLFSCQRFLTTMVELLTTRELFSGGIQTSDLLISFHSLMTTAVLCRMTLDMFSRKIQEGLLLFHANVSINALL